MIDREAVRERLGRTLSDRRLRHVLGCVETAGALAPAFGADAEKARDAALLHDITRELSVPEQLQLCARYGIMTDEQTLAEPALLHALTGAGTARELGADEDVVEAIRCHTTGKVGMTPLDMTLCLADYIEPTRKFKTVEELRRIAAHNPRAALLRAFDGTIVHIIRDDGIVHPATVEARNDLLARLKREDPGALSWKEGVIG